MLPQGQKLKFCQRGPEFFMMHVLHSSLIERKTQCAFELAELLQLFTFHCYLGFYAALQDFSRTREYWNVFLNIQFFRKEQREPGRQHICNNFSFPRYVLLGVMPWVMVFTRLTEDFTTWGQLSAACWSSISAPIFGSKKPKFRFDLLLLCISFELFCKNS